MSGTRAQGTRESDEVRNKKGNDTAISGEEDGRCGGTCASEVTLSLPRHEEGRGGGDVKRIVRRGGQICKFKAPPLSSSVNGACPIKCKFPSPRNALATFNISSASALDRLVHGGLGVPRLLK